jgi:hypothetical protein
MESNEEPSTQMGRYSGFIIALPKKALSKVANKIAKNSQERKVFML